MKILTWLWRAFLFFTLFAFASNNLQDTTVNGFFGTQWSAPLVIVVLTAFAVGAAVGILAMTPAWWRHRRRARRLQVAVPAPAPAAPAPAAPPDLTVIRDGL